MSLKELIKYVVIGVLTTLVNFMVYFGIRPVLSYQVAIIVAWIVSVLFAFITNKYIVFESKSFDKKLVFKELFLFSGARIVSLVLELVTMYLMLSILQTNELSAKLVSQVLILVTNFVLSKWIFKSNKKDNS